MQPGKAHRQFDQAFEQSLLVTSGAAASAGVNLRAESYGTFNRKKLKKLKAFTWRAAMLVVALAIFTYHSMTYSHILPIFLQDKDPRGLSRPHDSPFDIPGGIGLST
ncbi:hypothetical protein PENVUL_c049G06819 [Penicillium vulpinum]|uniref:Uncharacterized protein n=1 Tax=Penicillium vulpinum TaxID=29845 RepID=A0A1V6RGH9_9EURO|nr:hypothetical protein PENVUL_c049G06819 [Penicillium vulpinum]